MHHRLWVLLGVAGWLWAALNASPALGQLTAESPEVQKAIDQGVHWLESAQDPRLGAKALVGLVLLKREAPPDHPKIVEAVTAIQRQVRGDAQMLKSTDVYSLGLSTIFLVTLDPQKYRTEIDTLLKNFEAIQKPHGGFGYPEKPTGDTSMTQYAVLAMWEAHQSGIDLSSTMVDNVLDWLLRTQDPSGAFGYQGNVAPSPTALVAQDTARPSLATAGLGSVYVCSDLLGLVKPVRKKSTLPPALKEIRKPAPKPTSRLDPHLVDATKSRGNQWLQGHSRVEGQVHVHYFLYAWERYWSFREAAEGPSSDFPDWYDEGANYLVRSQQKEGCWVGDFASGTTNQPSVPDTCFSLLFLLRSMKKSIEHVRNFGPGLLVGGKGLPRGSAAVELRGGQVVAKPLAGPAQGLLTALENIDSNEFDQAVEALTELPSDEARALVSQNEAKLRELVESGHAEARLAAVRALGKTDDLSRVPLLIYALDDADATVALAARDALRRLSRRLDEGGMPDAFTEGQRATAIQQWKAWYLTIQPDAEFEE